MTKKSCGNCGETECEWYDHNYVEDDCAQWCSRGLDYFADGAEVDETSKFVAAVCVGMAILGVVALVVVALSVGRW